LGISQQVRRRLWSSSGGFCQNPSCRAELFRFFDSGKATSIEELAHVIAQKLSGARGQSELPASQRDEFENLILLCPTCHTLIDKNADEYPEQLILRWKEEHQERIRNALLSPVFSSRVELHSKIQEPLALNREIFRTYGPHSAAAKHPFSDAADMWSRLAVSDIIPNNRRIIALLRANNHLLRDSERKVVQEYVVHAEAFEYNHLSGDKSSAAPLFPDAVSRLLEERN